MRLKNGDMVKPSKKEIDDLIDWYIRLVKLYY